jgi:EAL domain-containing protein (putative c-di-GMP-specific phosphodiesterase class I)
MEKVCFEVTETAGIANLSNASEFILEVKKTGCTFALDDFGSGLSSYAYLKNLPVDFLKIDGAFVKDMDSNPYDYAVVKSITEIGHFMGKGIIAEYVENETILNMLREIGVDYAQGYVIGKPCLEFTGSLILESRLHKIPDTFPAAASKLCLLGHVNISAAQVTSIWTSGILPRSMKPFILERVKRFEAASNPRRESLARQVGNKL